jgi:hypothetical protein
LTQTKTFHGTTRKIGHRMSVLLRDVAPPIRQVAELGQAAVAVYSLLFQSAHKDRNYSVVQEGEVKERRDCGGTTSWSHKAIADTLHMGEKTVRKSTDLLLDNGYITVIGWEQSSTGSNHRIYRVLHPNQIESQRHVISLFDEPPSVRWRSLEDYKRKAKQDTDTEAYSLEEVV